MHTVRLCVQLVGNVELQSIHFACNSVHLVAHTNLHFVQVLVRFFGLCINSHFETLSLLGQLFLKFIDAGLQAIKNFAVVLLSLSIKLFSLVIFEVLPLCFIKAEFNGLLQVFVSLVVILKFCANFLFESPKL
jgi:hypothetical protein